MADEELVSAEAPAEITTPVETSDAAPETAAETDTGQTAEDSWDEDLQSIFDKHSREREPDGRFAKTKTDQSPTEQAGEQSAEASAIPVPQSWSADVKAKWESLPSDVKAYVAKREQEAHAQITRQGQQIASVEPVMRVVEQGKATFDKYGVPVEEGVAQLLQANEYLERDPASAIRDLAKSYGVDLRALVGLQAGNVSQPVQQLHDRISQLERQNNELSNRVLTRERAEFDRHAATVESQIADFAKDKPDFEELQDDITDHIVMLRHKNPEMAPADILKTAYDRARWANPDARQKALEAEQAKRLEEAKKRSNDVKRSAPLNVKGSVANSSAQKSMDDDLAEIARRHYSN